MRALSIRQPFAELILRGLKTIEYRSRPTSIIGERFWIYASKGKGSRIARPSNRIEKTGKIVGDNIVIPTEPPPPWMVELANGLRLFPYELPCGVIVGSAVIKSCRPHERGALREGVSPLYEWHLADVQRLTHPRKPAGHPQPVWFNPDPQS